MEIKPFWCRPAGQNTQPNGQELTVAVLSQTTRQNYQMARNRMAEQQRQTQAGCGASAVSGLMSILLVVMGLAAIPLLLSGNLMGVVEVAACAGMVYGILWLINRSQQKKEQQIKATPAYRQAEAYLNQVSMQVNGELGIPQNSVGVDVLIFPYAVENFSVRNTDVTDGKPRYTNRQMRMFADSGWLYLVTDGTKYGFDLGGLESFGPVAGPIVITQWNKWPAAPGSLGAIQVDDEDSSSGYRVDAGCCVLSFRVGDTYYPVYLPAYELNTVRSIIS